MLNASTINITKQKHASSILCGYQATVIVGTVMEKTRIDITKWFLALYLVAHDKRDTSACMLSQKLEISYKTAWLMLHNIRKAIIERDSQYKLARFVELDDVFSEPRLKVASAVGVQTRQKCLLDFLLIRRGIRYI